MAVTFFNKGEEQASRTRNESFSWSTLKLLFPNIRDRPLWCASFSSLCAFSNCATILASCESAPPFHADFPTALTSFSHLQYVGVSGEQRSTLDLPRGSRTHLVSPRPRCELVGFMFFLIIAFHLDAPRNRVVIPLLILPSPLPPPLPPSPFNAPRPFACLAIALEVTSPSAGPVDMFDCGGAFFSLRTEGFRSASDTSNKGREIIRMLTREGLTPTTKYGRPRGHCFRWSAALFNCC